MNLLFFSALENIPSLRLVAMIVGMSRSCVFVKQLDMIPKIKVGVYILEKDIQKVGSNLSMF